MIIVYAERASVALLFVAASLSGLDDAMEGQSFESLAWHGRRKISQ